MTVSEISPYFVSNPTKDNSDHGLCLSNSAYFVDMEHVGCHETIPFPQMSVQSQK